MPDSNKHFSTRFGYLYSTQGWNLKTSLDIDPKLEDFNNHVPMCNQEESIIVRYARMTVELDRKPIFVKRNWIPKRGDLKKELLLSAYDISLKVNKSEYLF